MNPHAYIGLRGHHTRPGKDQPPIAGIVVWIGDTGNSATEDGHLAPAAWLLLASGAHADVPLYSLAIHAEDVGEATRRLRAGGGHDIGSAIQIGGVGLTHEQVDAVLAMIDATKGA